MKYSRCKRKPYEHEVQNNLAMTPSDMARLTAQGRPVAAQNLGLGYQEGVSDLDFEPPAHLRRGVDMNDLFDLHESAKDKVRALKKKISQSKTEKTE